MRADELLRDAVRVDYVSKRGRVPVGERVVADHSLDGHAEAGVERDGTLEDTGGGGALFVVVDLCVGESGVIVDHGVDVVVTDPAAADLLAAPVRPPPTTVRDSTELLHVDMDQRAGMVVFIPTRRTTRRADHGPGHRVDLAQQRGVMPT